MAPSLVMVQVKEEAVGPGSEPPQGGSHSGKPAWMVQPCGAGRLGGTLTEGPVCAGSHSGAQAPSSEREAPSHSVSAQADPGSLREMLSNVRTA